MNHLPVKPTERSVLELLFESNHGLQKFERIAQARNGLQLMGEVFIRLNEAGLNARIYLGRMLITVKQEKLWEGLVGDNDTWHDFMVDVLPKQFNIGSRLAYDAMEMASSETLSAIPVAELAKIPISNARALVKAEKTEKPTAEMVADAQTMPPKDFKETHSVSSGAMLSKWIKDAAAVPHWRRVFDSIGGMSAHRVEYLADFLESPELGKRAGDGPDNKIDCILATVELEWQNEEDEIIATDGEVMVGLDADHAAFTEEEDSQPEDSLSGRPAPVLMGAGVEASEEKGLMDD